MRGNDEWTEGTKRSGMMLITRDEGRDRGRDEVMGKERNGEAVRLGGLNDRNGRGTATW